MRTLAYAATLLATAALLSGCSLWSNDGADENHPAAEDFLDAAVYDGGQSRASNLMRQFGYALPDAPEGSDPTPLDERTKRLAAAGGGMSFIGWLPASAAADEGAAAEAFFAEALPIVQRSLEEAGYAVKSLGVRRLDADPASPHADYQAVLILRNDALGCTAASGHDPAPCGVVLSMAGLDYRLGVGTVRRGYMPDWAAGAPVHENAELSAENLRPAWLISRLSVLPYDRRPAVMPAPTEKKSARGKEEQKAAAADHAPIVPASVREAIAGMTAKGLYFLWLDSYGAPYLAENGRTLVFVEPQDAASRRRTRSWTSWGGIKDRMGAAADYFTSIEMPSLPSFSWPWSSSETEKEQAGSPKSLQAPQR